ncbi:replication protein C, partial [Rhodobacterales bacterium]
LLGLVQGDDFNAGRRPVVAISNQRLADYTRKTTRTVTRCLKKLVEAGILAYRDSPTGRRFVYRGSGGVAEQAYGLDFTPACFNLEAFKQQADTFQRRLKAEQEAKRTITRCSRAVVDMVTAFGSEFETFLKRIEAVREWTEAGVFDRAGRIEQIYLDAVAAQQALNEEQMSCAGDIGVIPLSITTHPDFERSNDERTCSNEQDTEFPSDNGSAVEMALEKEPCGGRTETQRPKRQADRAREADQGGNGLDGVSIGLIQAACSHLQAETGYSFGNWQALCGASDQLRILIGLSEAGYQLAVERQGRYLAAACLAVVAEKALRDPQQISSPGGYFRAMIDRAGEGKLHLHKSLHGLAQ